jgi:hypothetical protein
MKKILTLFAFIFAGTLVYAQDNQTIFKNAGISRSGGYGAISNKFSTINGDFVNMPEVYGGWFVNRKFMIGFAAAATTNYIPVAEPFRNFPAKRMTYQYGQAGLMTEYVMASTKMVHFNFNLLTGAGFTTQYDRNNLDTWDFDDWDDDDHHKANVFFVLEPGVQVEINVLKWMRFSPGVSYRRTFGASGDGLSDTKLSNISYNLTLKFGRF